MAKEQYTYQTRSIAATPRNKRLTDSIQAAAQTGGGGGIGYPSTPQYWELVTSSSDGNPLEESQYYLRPISGKHVIVPGDVVAFADGGEYASGLPVADYDTFGLFKAKQGGGLLFDANEGWYVDPEYAGGGGIDEEQLKQYLTDNNYITVDYLTKQGYLTLSSPLTEYTIPDAYSPITAKDTILSAIGKLERNFGNYVDLTTNQTIGGVKTFNETILSKKDVIAYADGGEYASGLPVADTVTYGLVKVDGTTVRINASGQLEADSGGGIDFTVGTGLDLSAASVLSVKFGTTPGTACQGNDSRLSDARRNPYYLSWTGYSSGSYDGSSSESFVIPSNTNQLTNGAGFIYDADKNIFSLVGSGNRSQYLAGNGRFYTISHSDIDGLSSNYVTLSTTQTITGQKSYTALGWYKGIGILRAGSTSNMYIAFAEGSGNCINAYNAGTGAIGNIYLNYQATNAFTRIDPSNNLVTTGDVIAYADGGNYASGLPVADTYTYGLIKYDGTTIGKNSSGQLYVINSGSSGGGSTAWSDITGKPSGLVTSVSITSSGNCITGASFSNGTLTLTKGTISGGTTVSWGSESYHVVPLTVGSTTKTVTLSGHTHEWDTAITNKPSWLNSSTKPTYTWSEITNKPTVISSITYSTSGSGDVVTGVTASGNTVYVTKGSISGGGDWNGGTVYNDIIIRKTNGTLRLYSGSNNWALWCDGSSSYTFRANYNSTEMFAINTSGGWWFKGSQQSSDLRKKDIIGYVQDVLDKMIHISVIRFRWNDNPYDDGAVHIGLGAQIVKPYFPDAVGIWDDSLTIDYSAMGCIAFQGVKELYTRFLPVENKVKILESRVQNLQLRLDNAYREIFELKRQMGGAA